jgi:hypothetical protein
MLIEILAEAFLRVVGDDARGVSGRRRAMAARYREGEQQHAGGQTGDERDALLEDLRLCLFLHAGDQVA